MLWFTLQIAQDIVAIRGFADKLFPASVIRSTNRATALKCLWMTRFRDHSANLSEIYAKLVVHQQGEKAE